MRLGILATTIALGLAGPAAANVFLDFTSGSINTNNSGDPVVGLPSGFGPTYTISAGKVSGAAAALSNSTHSNNVGCSTSLGVNTFANFACTPVSGKFDVGFGVKGRNNNEVDGAIKDDEFVKVKFTQSVFLRGFAGMLTYSDNPPSLGLETVFLQAYHLGVLVQTFEALPLFQKTNAVAGAPTGNFDTVGLAFLDGLKLKVDEVRFLARGISPFDDGNTNITAAGLKISAIPLPAGVLLLGLGLGGLAAYRRRQRA